MPYIARDSDGTYRLFGVKPTRAFFVSWDGEIINEFTWTANKDNISSYNTYGPMSNNEGTTINESDSPVVLENGEMIEVKIMCDDVKERNFIGGGI